MDWRKLTHLGRFKEVVLTLIRFGFDDVVDRLDLPAKFLVHAETETHGEKGTYERIRLMLEELGPAYIKFGQVMSLRPDLVPHGLIVELSKLQDEVAPVSFDKVRRVVEESTGRTLEEMFSTFEEKPLASASLAQVHRAVLREEGLPVAVKVLKPGIRKILQEDLGILETLAEALDDRLDIFRYYDLPGIVREMKRTLMREVDMRRETRNMRIARRNLEAETEEEVPKSERKVRIPETYGDYCGERVLTMELFDGTKLRDLEDTGNLQGPLLARQGLSVIMRQIMEHGFFHADPHPGNVIVLGSDTIGLMDWGMVGRLTRSMRFELIDLVGAVLDKDSERIVEICMRLARMDTVEHRAVLERETLDVLDDYYNVPVREIRVGNLMIEITALLRQHRLRVPADLAVMIKALITAEGTARLLDPELNVVAEAEPIVRGMAKERFTPSELWRGFRRGLLGFIGLQRKLPERLDRIFDKMSKGELALRFRHENLEGLINALERITNRLAFAMIIGAVVIGSSLIITTGIEPHLFGFPALGVVGFVISAVLGLWLVVNIIRRKKL